MEIIADQEKGVVDMPTYEYECENCGHRFEEFQSITEEPIRVCPKCNGRVNRLIGAGAGILFKGSGFYITDYRSESYKQAAKRDSELSSLGKATSSDKGRSEKSD